MNWLRINSFLILIMFLGLAQAQQKQCAKISVIHGDRLAAGHLIEKIPSGNETKLILKDFKGHRLSQLTIPRSVDWIAPETPKDAFIYTSKGKTYHLDLKTKKEQEIPAGPFPALVFDQDSTIARIAIEGGRYAYDLKTQKYIATDDYAMIKDQTVAFAKNIASPKSGKIISVHDFDSGQGREIKLGLSESFSLRSARHIAISGTTAEGKSKPTRHFVLQNGKWNEVQDSEQKILRDVLSNGDVIYSILANKNAFSLNFAKPNIVSNKLSITTEVYDSTGKKKGESLPGSFLASGKMILNIDHSTDTTKLYSEKNFISLVQGNKTATSIKIDKSSYFPSDGEWVKLNFNATEDSLVSLETGKSLKIPKIADSVNLKVSQDGKRLALMAGFMNQRGDIVDLETGQIRSFRQYTRKSFDENFLLWVKTSPLGLESLEDLCVSDKIKVTTNDCNCRFKNADSGSSISEKDLQGFSELTIATMCSASFDQDRWDKLAPIITKGEISEKQALIYLKRFQKEKGYKHAIHFPILAAILKSNIVEKSPSEVQQTLKTLASYSPSLIEPLDELFKVNQRIASAPKSPKSSGCRSPQEDSFVKQKFSEAARVATNVQPTTTSAWNIFKPFKDDFQTLPKSQREAIVDGIATSLSQGASSAPELDGVFQSKLYYFSKKYALSLVGDSFKPATDLTIAMRNGKNVPVIMASGKMMASSQIRDEESTTSDPIYGFDYQVLPAMKIPEEAQLGDKFKSEAQWQFNGQPYSAKTTLTVLPPLTNLVSNAKSPDYKALKKDGKLTGMMIIGNNLSGQGNLMDEYLTYYQNAGFTFAPIQKIDAVSFLKDSIKNGDLGYFIKEAHSDADERSLMSAGKSGNLYTGTLKKPDGSLEVIHLLAPEKAYGDSLLISNQEFGEWVRARKKNQPLVYFNSSCYSSRKVISEIAAAHSPNLIPIASDSSTVTFTNKERSGMRQMIHAFRQGKDYDGIRAEIAKSQTHKNGDDRYLFPDEKDYEDRIRKQLTTNVDVEILVRDKSGKKIEMSEQVDH